MKGTYWNKFGKRVLERDGNKCHYCGTWTEDCKTLWHRMSQRSERMLCGSDEHNTWLKHMATLDHIKPRAKGGLDSLDNFVIACRYCNSKKGAR